MARLSSEGREQGVAFAAPARRESDAGRGAVRGDDFMALGDDVTSSEVVRCPGALCDMKCAGALDPGQGDFKEIVFLSRVFVSPILPGKLNSKEIRDTLK